MRTLKIINIISALTLTGLAILFGGNAAHAFPAFATKEKKPCAYCHVNPKGAGKRTVAGDWYKAHKLSFVGYKPAGAAPAKPAPKKPAKPAPAKKPSPKPPKKKG